jgi:hypothetical protein
VVDESGSEGNAGGFATEDDARFATSTLSFSKSLSIFLWRRSAAWWYGGWFPAAVSGCQGWQWRRFEVVWM